MSTAIPTPVALGLALSLTAMLVSPPPAEACSAPEPIEFSLSPRDTVPIAREGVAVIGVIDWDSRLPVVVRVIDTGSSTEVPGSVEEILFGPIDVHLSTFVGRQLYVWRATGPFDPEGSYQVEMSSGSQRQELPGVVAAAEHPGSPAPDTALIRANRAYEWTHDCTATAPEAYCYDCTRRDPVEVVQVSWGPGPEAADPFVTYDVTRDPTEPAGAPGEPVWHPGAGGLPYLWEATLVYPGRAEQYCAVVTSTSLIDGTTTTSERHCLADGDLAEIGPPPMPRGDGGVGPSDGGAVDGGLPVADGGTPDAVAPDGGAADAAIVDSGGSSPPGGGGGCGVAAPTNTGGGLAAGLALLGVVMLVRRRR